MNQLFMKDIPTVDKLFDGRTVAMLKGRKNYFCPHRFHRWIYPNTIYYQDVIDWYQAQKGDITDLPRGVFDLSILDKMSADSNQCIYNKCDFHSSCPFNIAKDVANDASIVITNHHLLLTDIAMAAEGSFGSILEPADHIIFDEAHSIPDIYAMYAGVELPIRRLAALIADYKDKLPFDDISSLLAIETKLKSKMRDGKTLYDEVREETAEFMTVCRELVQMVPDEELRGEFGKWEAAYQTLSGTDDGLRFAEQRGWDVTLKFIPFHIGGSFVEGLHQKALSSVFISATLSSGGNFEYFMRETGVEELNVTTATLPSAFTIANQGILYVPKEPETQYNDLMLQLIKGIDGSVLIICNSIKRMEYLTDYLKRVQRKKKVYSQYEGDWDLYVSTKNMVLVGCATLREGLDLAKGDYKCVIIDKLPFEHPHDLYLSRKAQLVEQEVGNSFMNFNLPRAVLYFKQAVGRLIRHESDRGVWAVFDNRILTKSYGKYFIDVLNNVSITNSIDEAINFIDL
jgi:ATP-dependent DNA helicase DinG